MTRTEADRYFTVTENGRHVVLKLRSNRWLETKTLTAFIQLMQRLGAVHTDEKYPVFEISYSAEAARSATL